ncbi:hypothetical protein KR044_001003, partial [Drosophila immigrans]
ALISDVCNDPPFSDGVETPLGHITCEKRIKTWSYVSEKNICKKWHYGGCGGNLNRFATKSECNQKCLD